MSDCHQDAVMALRFQGQAGHTHVCAEHERIDREWTDVIESGPAEPCPWAFDDNRFIGVQVPTLL